MLQHVMFLVAGLWAYRARDGLATAMHGMWGSFWMAYGLLHLFFAVGALTAPTGDFVELGYWFVVLSAITFSGAIAAHGENLALAAVLHTLWVGAGLLAVAEFTGSAAGTGWAAAAGWVLVALAGLAWKAANIPGRQPKDVIELSTGEPGVK